MGIFSFFQRAIREPLLAEQGRWFLWVPVLFGVGIRLYFYWPYEPDPGYIGAGALTGILLLFCSYVFHSPAWGYRLMSLMLALPALGAAWAYGYTHVVSFTPLLREETPPLGLVGRLTHAEQTPHGYRLTYNDLRLSSSLGFLYAPHHQIKLLMRHKLTSEEMNILIPGTYLQQRVVLTPWSGPQIIEGYHAARSAYFEGNMAGGYALTKPTLVRPLTATTLSVLRHRLTEYLYRILPGQMGAIAAALITGEKGKLSLEIRQQFSDSGLAHILAISGLHMSLVMGAAFMLMRVILIPLASRYNVKKWSVWPTALLGAGYLLISGCAIPAQRAFLMHSIVLGGILVDRPAISMRLVAIAALAVLMLSPAAILSPSFQLSFAAVVALIAFYENKRKLPGSGIVRYVGGIILTTCIATLATFPITLFTFNSFTLNSVFANLIAIPLTSFIIVPLALVALFSALWGDFFWIWKAFFWSLWCLSAVARQVSSWPGSHLCGPTPSWEIQSLMIMGALWVIIWQKPWRWLGGIPILGACVYYYWMPVPDMLVDGSGRLIGLYQGKVLYVSTHRSKKRTREQWRHLLWGASIKPWQENGAFTVQKCGQVVEFCLPSYKIQMLPQQEGWGCRIYDKHHQEVLTIDAYDRRLYGMHEIYFNPTGVRIRTVYPGSKRRIWDL